MRNIISAKYGSTGQIEVTTEDGLVAAVPDWGPGQLEMLAGKVPKEGEPTPMPINMDRVAVQEWEDAGGVIAPYEPPPVIETKPGPTAEEFAEMRDQLAAATEALTDAQDRIAQLEQKAGLAAPADARA